MQLMHWEWEEMMDQFERHRGWTHEEGIFGKYVNNFEEFAFGIVPILPENESDPFRVVNLMFIPGTWDGDRIESYLYDYMERFTSFGARAEYEQFLKSEVSLPAEIARIVAIAAAHKFLVGDNASNYKRDPNETDYSDRRRTSASNFGRGDIRQTERSEELSGLSPFLRVGETPEPPDRSAEVASGIRISDTPVPPAEGSGSSGGGVHEAGTRSDDSGPSKVNVSGGRRTDPGTSGDGYSAMANA